MGPKNAAITIACILERAGQISSAGGYLRDLTARAGRQAFSPGPMLMALLRATGAAKVGGGAVRAYVLAVFDKAGFFEGAHRLC